MLSNMKMKKDKPKIEQQCKTNFSNQKSPIDGPNDQNEKPYFGKVSI